MTLNQLCNVDSENEKSEKISKQQEERPWPDIGEEDGKEDEAVCGTNQHDAQVHPASFFQFFFSNNNDDNIKIT